MNLLLFGSCVSRDSMPLLEARGHRLGLYVARQSIVSIDHPVSDPSFTTRHLPSRFQERLYRGDLAGDALTRIRESLSASTGPTALVWDLTDERGGFLRGPDAQVLSRSSDGEAAGFHTERPAGWELVPFASLRHLSSFIDAAQVFTAAVNDLGIADHALVLANRWAAVDDTGAATPPSFGMDAATANAALNSYYEVLEALGWSVLDPGVEAVAATHHQWGLSAFHYTDSYYRAATEVLCAHLDATGV